MTTRVRRLLTPLGWGVLLVAVASWVVGARLHWQEFTLLAVAALLLVVVALLWQVPVGAPTARLAMRHLRLVAGGPTPSATLHVRAGGVPLLFPRVRVPVGPGAVDLRLPFLGPHAEHEETVRLLDLPRGVHEVGPVSWEKTDPVGLSSRTVVAGEALTVLVAPRVVELPALAAGLGNDLDGATSSQVSMNDLAFHALREYVPGDDLRHVHWPSSAKAGELLVRQYHETRRGHLTVLLDAARGSYPRPDDFELAVSVAASIALRATRDDLETYVRCAAHVARGRSAAAVTDAACRFALGDDDYLATAAQALVEVPATGLVVQVTGSARDGVELDGVARRFAHGSDWLVVRADSVGGAVVRGGGGARLRELSVPDLASLPGLVAGSLR